MWLKWWLAFFVALSHFLTSIRGHSLHPKLLLISFDGFRYDYLDLAARRNANISGFLKIWDSGFRAQWVENEFTTRTGPSHFSIVTGRHEESHGIIDNVFFDPELNKTFFFSSNLSMRESYWFDVGAEPIWVTNQRQGHKSGVIFWPGSTTPIKGIVPTAAYPVYNSSIPLKTRIDDVVRWLTEENMNLALLYYHEPDSQGHKTGPNSPELLKTIEELNEAIEYLLRKIKENKVLSLSLNIILTSDHGMIEVSRNDVIILENYLDEKMYFSPGPSVRVLWGLWPVGGYTQKNIIEKLSGKHEHLHVYRKEDVPPRLFYSASSRIAPVVVYPDPGWLIAKSTKDILTMDRHGDHGYDTQCPEMRPFFLAMGPGFARLSGNRTVPPIKMIDIYPMMCQLLELNDSGSHNGSLSRVLFLLHHEKGHHWFGTSGDFISLAMAITITIVVSLLLVISALLIRRSLGSHSTRHRMQMRRLQRERGGGRGAETPTADGLLTKPLTSNLNGSRTDHNTDVPEDAHRLLESASTEEAEENMKRSKQFYVDDETFIKMLPEPTSRYP